MQQKGMLMFSQRAYKFSFASFVALSGMLWNSPTASAALLTWINAAGGAASTPGNWTPNQVPNAADQLVFPLNNTYTITFNSSVPMSQTHSYRDGLVTLNLTSPHTNQVLIVGDAIGDDAVVTLTTGNLTTAAAAVIGNVSGSVGVLNINDGDAVLNALSQIVVGSSGDGTLNITGGGDAVTQFLVAGHAASAVSDVHVTGAGSLLDINTSATVGNAGDAVMTIGALGHVLVAQDMIIAAAASSNSQVLLNGGAALLDVDHDIYIGANTNSNPAGTGTLSATLAGICFADTIHLGGDPEGGSGTLRVDTGGLIQVNNLFCGDTGATLDLDDGLLQVATLLDPPNGVLAFGSSNGGSPILELVSASMTASAPTPGQVAINVGAGELRLTSGSTVDVAQGHIYLESSAASWADLVIRSGSSLDTPGIVHAGLLHQGHILLDTNGQLNAHDLFLADLPGGSGTVEVFGGGDVHIGGLLRIGGQSASAGGTALLNVQNAGSTITVDGVGANTHIYPLGTLYVGFGGEFDTPQAVTSLGTIIMEEGTINAGSLIIGGDVTADGSINGTISVNTGGEITATGPLTLGNPASIFGYFAVNGLLNVGSSNVVILDSNGADLGNTTIANGTLNVPNGSKLATGKTLSGRGNISGDLINQGTITSSGGPLSTNSIITDAGGSLGGLSFGFGNGGGYIGDGVIHSEVLVFTGGFITATGDLTMGDGSGQFTVEFDGELHIGPHHVTFLDADDSLLGSLTTIGPGGWLDHSSSTGKLRLDGVLRGDGLIDGDLEFMPATVLQPEGVNGDPTGTLNITGNCTMSNAGDVKLDIAGTGNFDLVLFSGSAALDGTLAVNVVDGFVPFNGQQFEVMNAKPITGTFDQVNVTGLPPCMQAQIIYATESVFVKFIGSGGSCPADIAPAIHDGIVNAADLLAVINSWGPAAPGNPADIVPSCGNGIVNAADLLAVINAWGACP